MSLKFVGLHAHTCFSVGDGFEYPQKHFDAAIAKEMSALAITDHGVATSFGYVLQAKKGYDKKGHKFKPIFGCEFYLVPDVADWKLQKEKAKEEKESSSEAVQEENVVIENEKDSKSKWFNPVNRRHHCVILAQNHIGLQNLFALITKSGIGDNFYRYPRIDFSLLKQHKDGLIVSSACVAGLPSFICQRDKEKTEEEIQRALQNEFMPLAEIFGPDKAFLEIQFNKLQEQRFVNDHLIKLSKTTGYKLLATADSHAPTEKDLLKREMYRILFRQGRGYKEEDLKLPESTELLEARLYVKNGEDMWNSYKEIYGNDSSNDEIIKEAIEMSYHIATDQIEDINPEGTLKLPNLYESPFSELKRLCLEGLKNKGLDKDQRYIERLITELKVIKDKNFSNYFLVLYKSLDKIREVTILGPARGSAGGSLVCYLLNIIQIDPIKNGLLFERFLSAARNESPDIDTDTSDRDKALDVLRKEFGDLNIFPVSNFITFQLKTLVKDISRLHNIPFEEVNEVTTRMEIEAKPHILNDIGHDQKLYVFDFVSAKKYSPTFQTFLNDYPSVGEHIESLFGMPKTIGRHAGGVVIVGDAFSSMPAIRVSKELQTPFTEGISGRHLEEWGLIKYDFLGVGTLRIIEKTIQLILKNKGVNDPSMEDIHNFINNHIHPDVINVADKKVFEKVYHEGNFPGIFQFSKQDVQNFCKKAKPNNVNDICAITALWRPGPIHGGAPEKYVEFKRNSSHLKKEHPIIEEVLKDNYYLIIYQEDFMQLAHKLAGFSLEESDNLRKLLVKPITSMADELKQKRKEAGDKFIEGCIKNGLSQTRAADLWEKEILGSISYSFNKSHAMAYAYLSYQTAWLYTYYEKEWIQAYLEEDNDKEKAISDVTGVGYKIGKISVNKSRKSWEIDGNTIYPSMLTIKGIGDLAVDELNEERSKLGGHFLSFEDFLLMEKEFGRKKEVRKIYKYSKFNRRALMALIQLESFEEFGIVGEGKLFQSYRHMYKAFDKNFDLLKKGTITLKEMSDFIPEDERHDWSNIEKIEIQKDLIGTYDKNLLFDKETLEVLKKYNVCPLGDLNERAQKIWFILNEYEQKKTKNGKPYWKLSISDGAGINKTFNYFNDLEVKKSAIYIGELVLKDGWVNSVSKSEIIRVS